MPSWAMPGSCATAVCVCTRPGEGGTFPARTFVALPSDLPALKDASHAHHAASRAGAAAPGPTLKLQPVRAQISKLCTMQTCWRLCASMSFLIC